MALTEDDFKDAANRIGCEVEVIKAVAAVESRGTGFDPEGFPVVLFEGHIFFRLTKGKHEELFPHLCYKQWTRKHYGKTWREEKQRLFVAIDLDKEAALKSASWGMFQILGLNYTQAGHRTIHEFYDAMCRSEVEHLKACVSFIITNRLHIFLQDQNWQRFARGYNGALYAENKYDIKLKKAYQRIVKEKG